MKGRSGILNLIDIYRKSVVLILKMNEISKCWDWFGVEENSVICEGGVAGLFQQITPRRFAVRACAATCAAIRNGLR